MIIMTNVELSVHGDQCDDTCLTLHFCSTKITPLFFKTVFSQPSYLRSLIRGVTLPAHFRALYVIRTASLLPTVAHYSTFKTSFVSIV